MAWVLDTVRAAPLLSGCVAFQATRFLFEDVYVALRQRSVVRPANLPPTLKDVLDVDEMERARRYALDSNLFGILYVAAGGDASAWSGNDLRRKRARQQQEVVTGGGGG